MSVVWRNIKVISMKLDWSVLKQLPTSKQTITIFVMQYCIQN